MKSDVQGNVVKKAFEPLYPKWTFRRSYHELPHYITTDDNSNQFARIALYALVNAVSRNNAAATPAPLELISPPSNDAHSLAQQAAYRARIESALKPMPAAFNR